MALLYFVIEWIHACMHEWLLQNCLCWWNMQVFGPSYPRGLSKRDAWNIGRRPPTSSRNPKKTETFNRFHWSKPLYQLLCKGLSPLSVWRRRTRLYKNRRFCSDMGSCRWQDHWKTGVYIWNPVLIAFVDRRPCTCNLEHNVNHWELMHADFTWVVVHLPTRNGEDCDLHLGEVQDTNIRYRKWWIQIPITLFLTFLTLLHLFFSS